MKSATFPPLAESIKMIQALIASLGHNSWNCPAHRSASDVAPSADVIISAKGWRHFFITEAFIKSVSIKVHHQIICGPRPPRYSLSQDPPRLPPYSAVIHHFTSLHPA